MKSNLTTLAKAATLATAQKTVQNPRVKKALSKLEKNSSQKPPSRKFPSEKFGPIIGTIMTAPISYATIEAYNIAQTGIKRPPMNKLDFWTSCTLPPTSSFVPNGLGQEIMRLSINLASAEFGTKFEELTDLPAIIGTATAAGPLHAAIDKTIHIKSNPALVGAHGLRIGFAFAPSQLSKKYTNEDMPQILVSFGNAAVGALTSKPFADAVVALKDGKTLSETLQNIPKTSTYFKGIAPKCGSTFSTLIGYEIGKNYIAPAFK